MGIDGANINWVRPVWRVDLRIQALTTTRSGGLSAGQFAQCNLASHVGDLEAAVQGNRTRLMESTGCHRVQWMDQVHGNHIIHAAPETVNRVPQADGAWTECAEPPASCCRQIVCLLWCVTLRDRLLVLPMRAGEV